MFHYKTRKPVSLSFVLCSFVNIKRSNMDKLRITQLKSLFDEIGHYINSDNNSDQVEIWFARELQEILGYARWENFVEL